MVYFSLDVVVPLQSCVPVITKLGPIVVRLAVRIANEANPFNLFVAVFQRHEETQRCAMILRQWCAHHLGDEQRLRMTADMKVIAGVVVSIGSFHVDIFGLFIVDECWRICIDKVHHADTGPKDNLTPTFDALKLSYEFMAG